MKHWRIRSRLALWTAVFLTIELLIFGIASGWVIYRDQLEAFAAIGNHPTSPTVVRKETGELIFDLTMRLCDSSFDSSPGGGSGRMVDHAESASTLGGGGRGSRTN